jgi:hypothetical protein
MMIVKSPPGGIPSQWETAPAGKSSVLWTGSGVCWWQHTLTIRVCLFVVVVPRHEHEA